MSNNPTPYERGKADARAVEMTDHMQDLLDEHGFGAAFMDALWIDEEERLPDSPYDESTIAHDDWAIAFARGMDARQNGT